MNLAKFVLLLVFYIGLTHADGDADPYENTEPSHVQLGSI